MKAEQETQRVLAALRGRIKGSPYSQRQIEISVGFSRGYLSQLLAASVELKFRHLIAILNGLGEAPKNFFAELYPPGRLASLEQFKANSKPLPESMDRLLGSLYELGLDSLADLRQRVESCESNIERLKKRRIAGDRDSGGG